MTPRELELLHRAFDDECNEEELHELEMLLHSKPELRREQQRLRALDVRLRLLEEQDVPADLLAEAFERIPPSARPRSRRLLPTRREFVGFAAGIAATFLLVFGLDRDALREAGEHATGTMLPSPTATKPIRGEAGDLGELRFVPSDDGEWLELRWRADRAARLTLDFEDSSKAHLDVQMGDQTLNVDLDRPRKSGP